MKKSRWDKHPLVADLIILTLPWISIFLIWVIFGVSIIDAAIQSILTSVILFGLIYYLNKKHDNTIFRYIGIK